MLPETSEIYTFGNFTLDLRSRLLKRAGEVVAVAPKTFDLLSILVQSNGRLISKRELMTSLWSDTFVEEANLSFQISAVRKALVDEGSEWIETVPKHGYRFKVEAIPSASGNGPQPATQPPEQVPLAPSANPPPQDTRSRRRLAVVAAALSLMAVAGTVIALLWTPQQDATSGRPLRRFVITAEENLRQSLISPDGARVAFITGYPSALWIRDFDREDSRYVAGSPDDRLAAVAWSPDGRHLAFAAGDRLFKVPAQGGAPLVLCRAPAPWQYTPGSWSTERGRILFGAGPPGRIFEIPTEGGEPRALDVSDPSGTVEQYRFPRYLPGSSGRRLLFQEVESGVSRIVAFDLDSRQREVLAEGQRPFYAPSGHVFYERGGSLWALPFSAGTMKRTGDSFAVARDANTASVSGDGTLVYLAVRFGQQQLVWRDRTGKELTTVGQPQGIIMMPVLSPDMRRVLVLGGDGPEPDVWVHDTVRGLKSRLTDHGSVDRPVWYSGGNRISYTSSKSGNTDIYALSANGGAEPETLVASPYPEFGFCWSSDDQYFIFDRAESAESVDIWYLHRKPDGSAEEVPFVKTRFDELSPSLSRDDRYLAFESNRSGQYEIYVRPFPAGDGEWQVSTHGGRQPRWRADGKELYYVKDGDTLMAAPVVTSPGFSAGVPKVLFKHADTLLGRGHQYDVSPDGQRFILVKTIQPATAVIRVVENWLTEFTRPQGE